jgi:3-oxoacyl-[acyl-carrier-protein] synthase-1
LASLSAPLFVCGAGAVTPGGLSAPQTLAAIRASISSFGQFALSEPAGAVQVAAMVSAHWKLKRSDGEWLQNMAARAIGEAMQGSPVPAEATALLVAPPETFRAHPAYRTVPPRDFLAALIRASGFAFHRASRAVDGGAAAGIGLLGRADELMVDGGVAQVLLGGVDSLVNRVDIGRLAGAGRLKSGDNAQGVVPGEGAVFVRLTRHAQGEAQAAAAIRGYGTAREEDDVSTEKYSQGRAQLAAFRAAVGDAQGLREADIAFIASNANGERYLAWEQMIARPRFFRTRRETFPAAYASMTVGDMGSAGGAMTLLLAADSLRCGYAPGPVAMCEVSSEGGLRAAAIISGAGRH